MPQTETKRKGTLVRSFEARVGRGENGVELIGFLTRRLSSSRSKAKNLLDARSVFVNRVRVWMARHQLQAGDLVEIAAPPPERQAPAKVAVLFEDDDYVIVNKPAGMLSDGTDSMETAAAAALGCAGLRAVHRLDKDTTGCLLLARSQEAKDRAVPLFEQHQVLKVYHAIAVGRLDTAASDIDSPIDGQRATTHIKTLDANRAATHLLARIDTGRTHQIRRHLATIHHPVLGDRYYGTRAPLSDKGWRVGRQMLHASSLEFAHPVTGRRVRATAPLPHDFHRCLKSYKLT